MTWTATKEEPETVTYDPTGKKIGAMLNVRAIIDIDSEQDEIKELIASLQKHIRADSS